MDNVSVFYPPNLTATGRKVPTDQYTLEVEVIGHVPDVGKTGKKQKKQTLTWPECLDLLPPERKAVIIQEALIEVAWADTEETAVVGDSVR